jgi:hypothetical protein
MADPITVIATSTIVSLAFQKFFEGAAGEMGKRFTDTAIQKMDQLRHLIRSRFQGNQAKAESTIALLEQGQQDGIDRLSVYLQDEMDDDEVFASELLALVKEINAGKIQDNSSITQNNNDQSTGFVTKAESGSQVTVAGQVHNHHYPPAKD